MERTEVLRSIAEVAEDDALALGPAGVAKGGERMALLSPVEGGWPRKGPAVLLLEIGSRWAASVRDMRSWGTSQCIHLRLR